MVDGYQDAYKGEFSTGMNEPKESAYVISNTWNFLLYSQELCIYTKGGKIGNTILAFLFFESQINFGGI